MHGGVLFSLEKGENSDTCYKIDDHEGHYAE
jgi:hypothetical protein